MTKKYEKVDCLAFIIFGLAVFFYLYEFALQVSPSVMTDSLMASFNLDAAGLGAMGAFYFYAYAPMQIPAGLFYDRYGPRILLTVAIMVCATGAAFFAMANTASLAALGRLFMGMGSAFSFIGVLVLLTRWFPAHYFALMVGLAQSMGSLGAITGEVPLAAAVSRWGWRPSLLGMAIIGFVLAFLVWKIIRDWPEGRAPVSTANTPKHNEWQRLGHVLRHRQNWSVVGACGHFCCLVGCALS